MLFIVHACNATRRIRARRARAANMLRVRYRHVRAINYLAASLVHRLSWLLLTSRRRRREHDIYYRVIYLSRSSYPLPPPRNKTLQLRSTRKYVYDTFGTRHSGLVVSCLGVDIVGFETVARRTARVRFPECSATPSVSEGFRTLYEIDVDAEDFVKYRIAVGFLIVVLAADVFFSSCSAECLFIVNNIYSLSIIIYVRELGSERLFEN